MNEQVKVAAATSFQRHERKFPLEAKLWPRALEYASRILPVERFDGVHDRVTIQTVYLDSPKLDSFREYIEESPVRRKIRIRQYCYDGCRNDICWLEVKLRHYDFSLKYRFRSAADEVAALLEGRDIAAHVARLNPGDPGALRTYQLAREWITHCQLRPVVRVDYQRIAFQKPGQRDVRLTLDRRIRFDGNGAATSRYRGAVMEVKFHEDEPDWLDGLMNELAIEDWSRFSKYARAVTALGLIGHC